MELLVIASGFEYVLYIVGLVGEDHGGYGIIKRSKRGLNHGVARVFEGSSLWFKT